MKINKTRLVALWMLALLVFTVCTAQSFRVRPENILFGTWGQILSLVADPAANDGNVKMLANDATHAALELDTQPSASAGVLHIKYNGTTSTAIVVTASTTELILHQRDFGNDVTGPQIRINRNINGTNASSGSLRFTDKSGTNYYLWVDDSGLLRIHTSEPTGTGDTSGTVVGTQS